jgi:hypothetical protein
LALTTSETAMGHSSLLGIDRSIEAAEPDGRSAEALGPSDSSDSGSDTTGTPLARGDGAASDAPYDDKPVTAAAAARPG